MARRKTQRNSPLVQAALVERGQMKAPPRAHIAHHHESDLREYFLDGVAYYSPEGTMGKQLERAMFFHQTMKPCEKCGGNVEKWTPGTGFVSSSSDHRLRELLAGLGISDNKIPGDAPCPACSKTDARGDDPEYGPVGEEELRRRRWAPGWVPGNKRRKAQTVRATGSSKDGSGVPDTGGTDAMERYGRTDRLLAGVRRISQPAFMVLQRWYGPGGNSPVALWDLTAAGKTMLRGNAHELPPHIYFDILRDRQAKQHDANRQLQFDAANKQGQEFYDAAVDVWVQVVPWGGTR
jgi:hypothetical protein